MVDGLVEERFSTRKGLLSRLFAWSPEEDDGEKNIQMAPIDPMMWSDLKRRMEVSEPMTLPMRPFLEKSSSFGPSDFLFQKKPETGTLRGHSRASTSRTALNPAAFLPLREML